MELGCQPVRCRPSVRARSGKPLCIFTRDSRSSAQANTTRPSSRNETVASLSSGLMPRIRIGRFQLTGDIAHGGWPKTPLLEAAQNCFQCVEEPGFLLRRPLVV